MTYGGGGLGYASINETLDLTAFGSSASAEGQLSSVELHFMGGIRIKPIYFEVTFSSLPYNGDVNFGGIILSGGLIF